MRRPVFQVLFLVSVGWIGCSSDRAEFEDGRREFDTPDASTDDRTCSGVSCSRDLRSVIDCSGSVARTCPEDLACGNGECVAPCDAAAMNEGSVGCSFSVPGPNTKALARGSCYAVFVSNGWTSPATLRFEFDGEEKSLDGAVWIPSVEESVVRYTKLTGPIPPGGGAVVFVSSEDTGAAYWTACPPFVEPIFDKEKGIYGTGKGHATLVSSDVPVSMYSIYPYGGASSVVPSAMLLFPTSSFRKNYMVVSAWGGKSDGFGRGTLPNASEPLTQTGLPTLQIVAAEDGTSIDIRPKVDILGGNGLHAARRNEVTNYTLQRGEVLQLMQDNDLVGSVIDANKPVGVFGGQSCMFVPSDIMACDIDNSQIPPISAWGHEYAVLPAPNRIELSTHGTERGRDPSPIRIVAAADDTRLTYEPAQPEGAPNTLASGQLGVFFAERPFVVRSQDSSHPLHVASVMTGAGSVLSTALGDPEVAMVTPTDQWLDTYGFFADYTYALSSVFVTRRKVGGAFQDVTLDCAGPLTGWKSITEDFEWTYVELTRSGEPQTYPAGTCRDGAHRIRSEGPFAMTVWGLSSFASYAYPGYGPSTGHRAARAGALTLGLRAGFSGGLGEGSSMWSKRMISSIWRSLAMRTRLSFTGTPVLAALTGLAVLAGACASSTDEASPPSETDAGLGDAGGEPKPDAGHEPTPDAGTDAGKDADADAAQPMTISGRVVGGDGEPFAGVGVSVAGMPIVQTALDGTFTFAGVTAPYDATVIGQVDGITVAHTFVGLSTTTPRIVPSSVLDVEPARLHATVTGTLGEPVPAGQQASVCIEGRDQLVYGCAVVSQGNSAYAIDAAWTSGSSVPVRVRVLRYAVDAQGVTLEYTAAGSKDATLSAGVSSAIDVDLGAAPAKATLTATVSIPPGSTDAAAMLFAKLGPWLSIPLEQVPFVGTTKTFVVPVLPGVSYSVLVAATVGAATTAGWEVDLPPGASANPKLVVPPTVTAPADGATGVTNATKFDVDNPGGVPLTLYCGPRESANTMFVVSTAAASITLPDLGAIGMPLPSGVQYSCGLLPVGALGGDPDALVTGDGPIGAYAKVMRLGSGGPGLATSGSLVTVGQERTVTTQ